MALRTYNINKNYREFFIFILKVFTTTYKRKKERQLNL